MAKWKYTNEKPKFSFDEYLKLDRDKQYTLLVKNPEIMKKLVEGNYRTIFQGTVIEIDGEKTEKIIIIKNYENVQFLKKKVAKKKEVKFEITRRYDEENLDTFFDISIIKPDKGIKK